MTQRKRLVLCVGKGKPERAGSLPSSSDQPGGERPPPPGVGGMAQVSMDRTCWA